MGAGGLTHPGGPVLCRLEGSGIGGEVVAALIVLLLPPLLLLRPLRPLLLPTLPILPIIPLARVVLEAEVKAVRRRRPLQMLRELGGDEIPDEEKGGRGRRKEEGRKEEGGRTDV